LGVETHRVFTNNLSDFNCHKVSIWVVAYTIGRVRALRPEIAKIESSSVKEWNEFFRYTDLLRFLIE